MDQTCLDPAYIWNPSLCECVLWGCPDPTAYPTVASWGYTPRPCGALDAVNRVWWLPQGVFTGSSAFKLSLIGTDPTLPGFGTPTFATDSLGIYSSSAQTDWSNGISTTWIADSLGYAMVLGDQGWLSWFDLASKNLVAAARPSWAPAIGYYGYGPREVAYDSARSRAYLTVPLQSPFTVVTFSCVPPGLTTDYSFTNSASVGEHIAYCPDTDTVYASNSSGTALYHKFNVSSHVFDLDKLPGNGGPSTSLFYLAGVKLLLVLSSSGLFFVDPLTDSIVAGPVSFGHTMIDNAVYNVCKHLIYVASGSQSGGLDTYDPQNGFAHVHLSNTHINLLAFDQYSNLVFGQDTSGNIATF